MGGSALSAISERGAGSRISILLKREIYQCGVRSGRVLGQPQVWLGYINAACSRNRRIAECRSAGWATVASGGCPTGAPNDTELCTVFPYEGKFCYLCGTWTRRNTFCASSPITCEPVARAEPTGAKSSTTSTLTCFWRKKLLTRFSTCLL